MNWSSINFTVPNNCDVSWMAGRLSKYSSYNIDLSNVDFTGASNIAKMAADSYGSFTMTLNLHNMPYIKTIREVFSNLYNCKGVYGISELNAPNCNNYWGMFYGFNRATGITGLNLCNWQLPNLNKLSEFYNVPFSTSFKDLDMCNWHVPNVTTTYKMFNYAPNLVNLNVQNMSLPLLTNAQSMFNYCPNLSNESLDQILNMMTVTSLDGSSKTLAYIGLKSNQAAICETLPNWANLQAAAWTTGY